MGVPAHDERDFEFAKINSIDIKQVIIKDKDKSTIELTNAFTENGFLINSNNFDGLNNSDAKKHIQNMVNEMDGLKIKFNFV